MLSQIFTGVTANGSSLVVDHCGGEVEVIVDGTFGSGTATLKAQYSGMSTWVPLANGKWTEPEIRVLRTVRKCKLRMDLTGATASNLNAWI